jgi:peptidoglycan hydrolase-like protein with peptidoglycan-binding domain
MTPGQARVALLSFLAVTLGVTFNVFFLQAKGIDPLRAPPQAMGRGKAIETGAARSSYPAPPPASEQQLRIARFAPDPGRSSPPATVHAVDRATVRAIQRELSLRGYGPLAEDGAVDVGTRAAIVAFEQDQGLPPSGEASERLLRRILFGSMLGSDAAPDETANARAAPADELIRSVQGWLAALGYQPGRVDGTMSEETVQAIRDFEVDKGLVPRGRISTDLVVRLSQAAIAAAPGREARRPLAR